MSYPFVVLDLETTWLSRFKHGITEIAAVRYDGDRILDRFQTFINPERHIPSKITQLTGITNEMVANAPLVADVLPEFTNFLGDSIAVAHNSTFDVNFLNYYMQKHHNAMCVNTSLCTRRLANRLLRDLPSKSLHALCSHYGITNMQAHRAMADVEATVSVLHNLLMLLQDEWVHDIEDIIAYQYR